MLLASTVVMCMELASARYQVPVARIESIIARNAASPSAGRVGLAGIPQQWMPYLNRYGFDVGQVESNDCENVIAGTWIIAYTAQVNAHVLAWGQIGASHGGFPAKTIPWLPLIRSFSREADVDANLVEALIEQESSYNPAAIGPQTRSGERAVGLMQILPSTGQALGINPYDPAQNLWGGIWYLSNLIRYYHGNKPLALAAYNAGMSAVTRYGGIPPYKETQHYVQAILSRSVEYKLARASNP